MSDLPKIAHYKPYYVELEAGKKKFWCACGLSNHQPYCDGSHKGTSYVPLPVIAKHAGEEVLLCGCKHTKTPPYCDGSHNNLSDSYAEEDPNSGENKRIPIVDTGSDGRAMLDGGCFVARMRDLPSQTSGTLTYARIIGAEQGATYQSQFYFKAATGATPAISFDDSDVVLFVLRGNGQIAIGDRAFQIEPSSGAYVRPGEHFALRATGEEPIECYVSACPIKSEPLFPESPSNVFDSSVPDRVVPLSDENRVPMADRFFQVLIGADAGCESATQFIGEIPKSKAARHRHLYEESLVLVTGKGMMWTENGKAPVEVGDVIFLPRKQEHSLECVVEDGMIVAGVIHPGDNPAINY